MNTDEIFSMDTPNVEVKADYSIVERIKAAAEEAKKDLTAPPAVLVVEKLHRKTLIVNIVDERLVVYHQNPSQLQNDGLEKLYDEPTNKYRAVLFLYCTECRIFVMSKVLKLTIIQCTDCQVSIRGGVIGLVELFRCVNTNVDIRSSFPLLTAELCNNVHMYQRMDQSVYCVIGAVECTINKVDENTGLRLESYTVEDLFSSRRFYHLSSEGVKWIEESYVLNNISLHLMALPPNAEEADGLPFGQTPPSVGMFTFHSQTQNVHTLGPTGCGWNNFVFK